ncbi:4-carboxymuconolactone decarboxylase [Choiromyces venosus 120613-1]|uniref:4-carboxymuconolactone decarboxylase n=1 Tax=Choiromyces venosus 120613-1 TaxID=1336337 RepID=A0A3N4IRX8_9PEZI|nr:4-carboxymuconolactone decarboxylase [Choiromyces venosus 120613-1]
MRLPYTPNPPPASTSAESQIISETLARRGTSVLLPLDLTLLHSPPITSGWNAFLGAIRAKTWTQHAPLAFAASVTLQGLKVIRDSDDESEWEEAGLNERQRAVLAFASENTRNVGVSEGAFERIRGLFRDREVVEIPAVVAYNCVSRLLVALDVGRGMGLR